MDMVNLADACGDIAVKACSKAIVSEIRPVFIIFGTLALLAMVLSIVTFMTIVKKPATKKVFWVGMVLPFTLLLLFIFVLYLVSPTLLIWFGKV